MNFENTFSPIMIGNMWVRNRLVVPAMDSAMFEDDGSVSQRTLDYYGKRADGGYGIVILEIAAIDDKGMGMPGEPHLYEDSRIPGLARLAGRIHQGGARALVQLHHAGRETTAPMIGGRQPVGPSAIPSTVYREPVYEMTTQEVCEMIDSYIRAARRCLQAGFDGVEIHAAHGYMGLQFFSPRTNKRIDEFGGDYDGRSRFLRLIVEGIHNACGEDFVVTVRIDSVEDRIGGIRENDAVVLARLLEEAGADALNVSAGTYSAWDTIVPPPATEAAWNWHAARRIRDAVDIPVMVAGRFTSPYIIEQTIECGHTDLVCTGRQSITDPEFPNKMMAGAVEDIIPCISCTQRCMSFNDHSTLQEGDWGISCMLNPMSNNRTDVRYSPAAVPKKVMVIGTGVAGMEAAQIAADRGHRVSIYEKNGPEKVGGQFLIASYPPYKQELTRAIRYYKHMCDKNGVIFHFNTEVTPDFIKQEAPDVLIIATGATPIMPVFPGVNDPKVVQANDVLSGKVILADSALLIGGGLVGVETAEFCRDYCDRVSIVEMQPQVATELYMTVRDAMLRRFQDERIQIYTNTAAVKIESGTVFCDRDGEEVKFEGYANIVLALGAKSYQPFEDTQDLAREVYIIGDAKKARSAVEAIYEAARVAMKI